jgi:hypothetical protein
MVEPAPQPAPGIAFLRGLALAMALAFGAAAISLFLPGQATSTAAGVVLLTCAVALLAGPAVAFLGLTWRHRALPRPLRRAVLRIATFMLLFGALSAWASPERFWDLTIGVALAAAGLVALVRALGPWHDWTESTDRRGPYRRFVLLGAISFALFLVLAIIAKSGHLSSQDVARMRLRSDLDAVVEYQRTFLADSGRYAAVVPPRADGSGAGTRTTKVALTPDGFTAVARDATNGSECALFIGSTAIAPAKYPDFAACSDGDGHPKRRFPDLLIHLAGAGIALLGLRRTA